MKPSKRMWNRFRGVAVVFKLGRGVLSEKCDALSKAVHALEYCTYPANARTYTHITESTITAASNSECDMSCVLCPSQSFVLRERNDPKVTERTITRHTKPHITL